MPDGKPLFATGQVVTSLGVLLLLRNSKEAANDFALTCLARHTYGDWGELNVADKARNDAAIDRGGRLFSCYPLVDADGKEHRVWCITEGSRSTTTLLLPEEY